MSNGGTLTGVFKRPKRQGRKQLEPLKVLAVFKDKVQYRKTYFDFFGTARVNFADAFNESMKKSIADIAKFGRVRTPAQRKSQA